MAIPSFTCSTDQHPPQREIQALLDDKCANYFLSYHGEMSEAVPTRGEAADVGGDTLLEQPWAKNIIIVITPLLSDLILSRTVINSALSRWWGSWCVRWPCPLAESSTPRSSAPPSGSTSIFWRPLAIWGPHPHFSSKKGEEEGTRYRSMFLAKKSLRLALVNFNYKRSFDIWPTFVARGIIKLQLPFGSDKHIIIYDNCRERNNFL